MTVAPTAAAAPTSASNNAAASLASLTSNFNTFLTLLTTQLKNQDPTAPLDSNQFTAQLVQMTGVEQQISSNALLQQLVANTGSSVASAVDLIGKQVSATTSTATLSNGQAQWTYQLDADTSNLKIQVLDANGNTVAVSAPSAGDSTAGQHTFTWNGKNLAGAALPDGPYTLKVTTQDASGADVATGTILVQGPVTGVQQANGQTMVTVNGSLIPLNQLTSITAIPTTSGSSSSTN